MFDFEIFSIKIPKTWINRDRAFISFDDRKSEKKNIFVKQWANVNSLQFTPLWNLTTLSCKERLIRIKRNRFPFILFIQCSFLAIGMVLWRPISNEEYNGKVARWFIWRLRITTLLVHFDALLHWMNVIGTGYVREFEMQNSKELEMPFDFVH